MENITEYNPTLANRGADLKAFLAGGSFLAWSIFFLQLGYFIFILNSSHGKELHVTFKQFKNS